MITQTADLMIVPRKWRLEGCHFCGGDMYHVDRCIAVGLRYGAWKCLQCSREEDEDSVVGISMFD